MRKYLVEIKWNNGNSTELEIMARNKQAALENALVQEISKLNEVNSINIIASLYKRK